jgi:hypothetical protein
MSAVHKEENLQNPSLRPKLFYSRYFLDNKFIPTFIIFLNEDHLYTVIYENGHTQNIRSDNGSLIVKGYHKTLIFKYEDVFMYKCTTGPISNNPSCADLYDGELRQFKEGSKVCFCLECNALRYHKVIESSTDFPNLGLCDCQNDNEPRRSRFTNTFIWS